MTGKFTEKQLDEFREAATSLKLFSRAELTDDKNRSLIEKLYVDPLPNDQAFKTLLGDNTTILIGRKGTGKSTIFQRVQHEIRKNKSNMISAYMDIRNVYESAQVDQSLLEKVGQSSAALPPEQIQKLLLYNGFFKALISGIRDDLRRQVEQNFLTRIKETMGGTAAEVFRGLDGVLEKLNNPNFENVVGVSAREIAQSATVTQQLNAGVEAQISASAGDVSASAKGTLSNQAGSEYSNDEKYSQILMRVMDVNNVISQLRSILDAVGIKYLYVFLDDFSELPEEAMKVVVDAIISPFTRWSEFIKFKIAAYPGRVYLGSLDKTKVEEFHLDLFRLYGSSGISTMEDKAVDFTKRLVEKRLSYYSKSRPEDYFDGVSADLWRVLFYASMANPRILGHILLYGFETHLLYGRKIGPRAVQEAARRYYEEKVAPFFTTGMYRTSFHERSSIYSLKELLEKIVGRARELRNYKESEATKNISGSTPSSHFYVSVEFDELLTTLELSFFITKYFEQADRSGARVSIYALNYGLCEKYQMAFGRPTDSRSHRLYLIERIFDYNSILRSYISENQEIKCDNCGALFDVTMLPALTLLNMLCPKCRAGSCHVVNLSRKYGDLLESVSADLLLPETELGILQTLHSEKRSMVAAELAADLDCSGQLIGRRAKHLAERALVTREKAGPVNKYEITSQAEIAYFSDQNVAELNLNSKERSWQRACRQ
jgi:Cdc6-like AAA superfamily ATPase